MNFYFLGIQIPFTEKENEFCMLEYAGKQSK